MKIKVKKIKPFKIACIEHVGEYGKIPFDEYTKNLFSWAKENKVRHGFKIIGIYHDNPEKIPPEKCRSEIGIEIKGEANPGENIKIKEIPEMEVAFLKHVAPASKLNETYSVLNKWIEEKGYEWAGPSMEIYTRKPKIVRNERVIYALVYAPIKKK